MLNPHKTKGRRATLVLALIFLILSLIYLIHEYQQVASKISNNFAKIEATPFFRLLLETDKKVDSSKPSVELEKKAPEIKEPEALIVKSIQLLPKHPSISDDIKAVATANYDDPKVSYEFKWYINDNPVEDIKDDTLPKGMFKKKDLISVSVTPLINDKKGRSFISVPIIIQNSPPSLDIKVVQKDTKLADIHEFQLAGSDPDGDNLTYSIVPPVLEGMTINSQTGMIIWKPRKKEKGIYKFTVSAADPDGGKVVKTFVIEIK